MKAGSIGKLLEASVSRSPEKAFLVLKNSEVTYEDFYRMTGRIASGFVSLGVKKGDKVAILLPNCLEYPYCWLAANMVGAVMVPVNARFVEKEVEYILNHSESKLLITNSEFMGIIENIQKDLNALDKVVNIDHGIINNAIPLSDLLEGSSTFKPVSVREEDPSVILYTSGTTGNPKGCVASHYYFTNLGEIMASLFQLTAQDRVYTAQPFYYMDPQWNTIMVMIRNATLAVAERFSTSKFWDEVRHYKVTCFYCIGSMTSFLFNMQPSPLDTQHNLRMVMVGGIPPGIHKSWEERFGVPVYEAYGSSETACDISQTTDRDRKVGTACIGRPVYDKEAKVVDNNDNEVPSGQVGEIVIKRCKAMMEAYYKDPEATELAFRGGWYHSGDLGYVDEGGEFHFVGRKKDLIKKGGENISVMSIEHVLMNHPKIQDAAVIPVPDQVRGEEVKAYIVIKQDEEMTYEEVISFCENNMAAFKVPRYLEFKNSLPKTPSERVQKHKLIREKKDLTEGCYDRMAK